MKEQIILSPQITIPWSKPWISDEDQEAVTNVFKSHWLSMGPKVLDFENQMATLAGTKHAIAVSNGTLALELALQALSIARGDEVLVPAFTYFATISSILRCGAIPVFVDINPMELNICVEDLKSKITSKTKAIVYIDYGGSPANFLELKRIATSESLFLIHDAAQSIGTTRNGVPILGDGDIATTSFHAAKLITTIEGGMVFSSSEIVSEKIRALRNQGETKSQKYMHSYVGTNARMTDLSAALGLSQLSRLPLIVRKRKELAENYLKLLADSSHVKLPYERKNDADRAWFFFPVLVEDRFAAVSALRAAGIDTRIAYGLPAYRQPSVSGLLAPEFKKLPATEYIAERVLTLPMYHDLNLNEQAKIAAVLEESQKRK